MLCLHTLLGYVSFSGMESCAEESHEPEDDGGEEEEGEGGMEDVEEGVPQEGLDTEEPQQQMSPVSEMSLTY